MAAADPGAVLLEETTCSICRELFTDPVTLDCGHNFCLSCLRTYMSKEDLEKACPECKQDIDPDKEMNTNNRLANIAEMVKKLQIAPRRPTYLCKEHGEKLQLFCEPDGELLCLVCIESRAHRAHRVTPVKEAEQEYKVKVQDWLQRLKNEIGFILKSSFLKEEQYHTMRNNVREEKQKIASEIEELQQLLRDEEMTLYQRLEEMEERITRAENANISNMSNHITSLNALITDLEEKCKEPTLDLLKDVRSTLNRCMEVKLQGPERIKKCKVTVTLDPDTAHPGLVLTEEGRCVRWADTPQNPLDSPKRFTSFHCVLGSEGFTSGRHYWEVQLLQEVIGWTVGVAAESVDRKGCITWSPEEGVLAVEEWNNQYSALTSPETPLSPRERPLKLGVYLDYDEGQLSLYNAETMELLYTFPRTTFTPRVFPIFCLHWGGELRLV